jgi:nicotinamide-nucleotide amidase
MKRAIILSVGDELVLGQTVDTNSAWISQKLASVGCDVRAHLTVPDDQRAIMNVIASARGRCDYLIISGGIGPTEDDLTRQALAATMRVPLVMDDAWLKQLDEFFVKRGRPMPEANKIQAMIPEGASLIWNTAGTAAGIDATLTYKLFEPSKVGREYMEQMFGTAFVELRLREEEAWRNSDQFRKSTRVFVMPGVPKEMKIMFERDVLPHIAKDVGGAVILSRTLHTFGFGESAIAEKLGDLMKRDRNPSVGTTVANGIVSLRVNARFDSKDEAQRELDATTELCRAALGDLIFGEDDQTLQQVVGGMLKSAGKTVTTAESCTGGLLAKMLTDVSGSSDYFQTGFVTYSNKAKYERLGVSIEIINTYGAVSEPVVQAMAKHARRLAKADYALAISGVAGPTGGTPAKPVGTVCIALAWPPLHPGEGRGEGPLDYQGPPDYQESQFVARTFHFPGDREWVRDRSAKMALTMLRFHLLGKPLPF